MHLECPWRLKHLAGWLGWLSFPLFFENWGKQSSTSIICHDFSKVTGHSIIIAFINYFSTLGYDSSRPWTIVKFRILRYSLTYFGLLFPVPYHLLGCYCVKVPSMNYLLRYSSPSRDETIDIIKQDSEQISCTRSYNSWEKSLDPNSCCWTPWTDF